MPKGLSILISLRVLMAISAAALGADYLTETVANGCKEELNKYCKDVTPG